MIPRSRVRTWQILGLLLLPGCRPPEPEASAPETRPNILLLVADDLGYADLGSYGGDIATPNIDGLAARGLRFSRFHTSPLCAPTRSMLLTGNDNHVAGMGSQGGGSGPTEGLAGYEGHLSDRVVPFPLLLRDAGYHTYSVGKWHLGLRPGNSPSAAGFERSFNLMPGAGDHFSNVALEPTQRVSRYWEDGDSHTDWPEGAYSTELYTDRLMEFIGDGAADGRPFFAFAAYTSPHWPLQAPGRFRDRYAGRYDMGYEELRRMRLESLKGAGMISEDWELPPPVPGIEPWEELTIEERRREARKMELYAAMVDNLDFHVGRLLDFLEERGLLENTLVVFMSDNGAAAEDFYYHDDYREWLQSQYDNSYDNMGLPGSYVSYGPQWADAGSAPFRGHKGHMTEGGIVTPMIVAGPGTDRAGVIEDAYVGVMDLAPTFLELAGAAYPGRRGGANTRPMTGTSITPLLSGAADRAHDASEVIALSHRTTAFVRQGDWKIVSADYLAGPESFALYDLATDPDESSDLSAVHAELFAELLSHWEAFRTRVGAYAPD